MNEHDIERALSSDAAVTPGPAFAARVMAAVERQARATEPLALPWRRLALGLAACAALATLAYLRGELSGWATAGAAGDPLLRQAATWLGGAFLSTWGLVRGTLRFAGYQRS